MYIIQLLNDIHLLYVIILFYVPFSHNMDDNLRLSLLTEETKIGKGKYEVEVWRMVH